MSLPAQSSLPSDRSTEKADLRRRLLKARQAIPPPTMATKKAIASAPICKPGPPFKLLAAFSPIAAFATNLISAR
jgi:hypothetical protein